MVAGIHSGTIHSITTFRYYVVMPYYCKICAHERSLEGLQFVIRTVCFKYTVSVLTPFPGGECKSTLHTVVRITADVLSSLVIHFL